jgi:hypothetical protein
LDPREDLLKKPETGFEYTVKYSPPNKLFYISLKREAIYLYEISPQTGAIKDGFMVLHSANTQNAVE